MEAECGPFPPATVRLEVGHPLRPRCARRQAPPLLLRHVRMPPPPLPRRRSRLPASPAAARSEAAPASPAAALEKAARGGWPSSPAAARVAVGPSSPATARGKEIRECAGHRRLDDTRARRRASGRRSDAGVQDRWTPYDPPQPRSLLESWALKEAKTSSPNRKRSLYFFPSLFNNCSATSAKLANK
jgi:hypothetical protein